MRTLVKMYVCMWIRYSSFLLNYRCHLIRSVFKWLNLVPRARAFSERDNLLTRPSSFPSWCDSWCGIVARFRVAFAFGGLYFSHEVES